ncbi:MAG: isoprenylcysteine carboxylmethyltransferase family protein [Chloroflexi bacterium]|nr:isoprenylcysteine carboxylmethyltransferase family protein [Chloroflexota bacterium]
MTQGNEKRSSTAAGVAMRAGTIAFVLVLQAALLFGGAGRLDWSWAWVYFGISLATLAVGGAIMLRTSPETIAERGRPKGIRGWDKAVSGVLVSAGYVAPSLAAALDVRFGWTAALSASWHAAGAVALTLGFGLTVWAMHANAYFFTAVRIQSERGHTVCRSGPYRCVRHPGYVGYALQSLAVPFLLGSLWALLPALAAVVAMVIRTALEDRMLQAELPGYREYAEEVRYRLIPGIW